ncbi:MAG: hypothetical protein K2V38_20040, partial [Gemmataceae bacterium]|nr:hypothetical protein [Gemmataceae bacterium]
NVVVWLRPDSDDKADEFPRARVHPDLAKPKPRDHTVIAAGGRFVPRVVAARAGDTITFDNRLPVPTNVKYDVYDDSDRAFNLLVGKDMGHTAKPLPVVRSCDIFSSSIHPWMRGYVRAFDHPYFAVTDAAGGFELPQVPAGTWRLVAWHERAGFLGESGRLGQKITVPANRTGRQPLAPLVFDSDRWVGP